NGRTSRASSKFKGLRSMSSICADRQPSMAYCRCLRKLLMKHVRLRGKKYANTSKPAAARAWLTGGGYDKQYGARPMACLIQTKIK
ncbi:MAG: hypothetical protein H0T92_24510, partial [Pyrinomonadaceae bacterium]|nr:hypothetical protein [Pyrinomonadaceae bacterium]